MEKLRLFRVIKGWVETRLKKGDRFVIVQESKASDLDETIEYAKETGGWIEEDGVVAHIPSLTNLPNNKNKA